MTENSNKALMLAAYALGLAVVVWMGLGLGHSSLALVVMVLITAAFLLGARELWRYQLETEALQQALSALQDTPSQLESWLEKVPAGLRHTVRKRIEDEHVGLPAPLLTPYLVGLLVMLGLLGTFVGMVDTLQGAVTALQGNTELEAVREGLAAPIEGLGLAFATSVAGISSSALLGLVSTLCRRQRLVCSRLLDGKVETVLAGFSLAQNRLLTYRALQSQAETLPRVAEQLSGLVAKLDEMAGAVQHSSEQLAGQLREQQQQFLSRAEQREQAQEQTLQQNLAQSLGETTRLAESLQASSDKIAADLTQQQGVFLSAAEQREQAQAQALQQHLAQSLGETTRLAEALRVSSDNIAADLSRQQEAFLSAAEQRYQALAASVQDSLQHSLSESGRLAGESIQPAVSEILQSLNAQALENQGQIHQQLKAQLQEIASLQLSSADGLTSNWSQIVEAQRQANEQLLARFEQQQQGLLAALDEQEQQRRSQLAQSLNEMQGQAGEQLLALGQSLTEPVANLLEMASETPRAAAELLEQLRSELSASLERDTNNLKERQALLTDLHTLSTTLSESSQAQSAALDSLLSNSETLLAELAQRFDQHLQDGMNKLLALEDNFAADSAGLGSLAEGFAGAVQQFAGSNTSLMEKLEGIAQGLAQAGERSDEQMAYYVAQAREIIDVNMAAQQEILSQLQQHSRASV